MFLNDESHQKKLTDLFDTYNQTLKPLIAEVEVCYEEFPSPVFNEIRAYNDHIARCFIEDTDIKEELNKAEGHLKRIILDCFKYLNVYNNDEFKAFNKKHKNVNLSAVSNGDFIKSYTKWFKDFRTSIRNAKKFEGRDTLKSLRSYENAYNYSRELSQLIENHHWKIWRAKALFSASKIVAIILWLVSIFAASVITYYFNDILIWFDTLFKS